MGDDQRLVCFCLTARNSSRCLCLLFLPEREGLYRIGQSAIAVYVTTSTQRQRLTDIDDDIGIEATFTARASC
jgi:hypothetical protein